MRGHACIRHQNCGTASSGHGSATIADVWLRGGSTNGRRLQRCPRLVSSRGHTQGTSRSKAISFFPCLKPVIVCGRVGRGQADGVKVSVFVFDVQKQPALADVARNTLKRLKTLRHPSLVTYLDGLELPTTFYMVTERVTPLRDALSDIKTNEHHLSWGLCQVLVRPSPSPMAVPCSRRRSFNRGAAVGGSRVLAVDACRSLALTGGVVARSRKVCSF